MEVLEITHILTSLHLSYKLMLCFSESYTEKNMDAMLFDLFYQSAFTLIFYVCTIILKILVIVISLNGESIGYRCNRFSYAFYSVAFLMADQN